MPAQWLAQRPTQWDKITTNKDQRKAVITTAEPGFALVAVLFLSVIITAMIPMMINFNRESVTAVQRGQSQAVAAEYAKQIFMMAHTELMMHQGLPQGWSQGNSSDLSTTSAIEDIGNCSGYLDLDETWNSADARISWMQIDDATSAANDSKVIAGITRTSYGDVPYDHYIVLGCAITGGRLSQGAVMRGEFAISGQQILMLSLSSNTS